MRDRWSFSFSGVFKVDLGRKTERREILNPYELIVVKLHDREAKCATFIRLEH